MSWETKYCWTDLKSSTAAKAPSPASSQPQWRSVPLRVTLICTRVQAAGKVRFDMKRYSAVPIWSPLIMRRCGRHYPHVESLLQNGCSESFKKSKQKQTPALSSSPKDKEFPVFFLLHIFVFHTEISLLMFHYFCSSLFTMFESTKFNLFMTAYLFICIFIFVHCFFLFPFIAILCLVCKIFFFFFIVICCYYRWNIVLFFKW